MEKNNNSVLAGNLLFIVLIAFTTVLCFIVCFNKRAENKRSIIFNQGFEQGYIEACKDFYKGKLKYDLVDNPDGTREWKKIEIKKVK